MEEILGILSELQLKALKQGISFDIDLHFNEKKVPTTDVKLYYSVTGGVSKAYAFNTTFSDSICYSKKQERIGDINYFISTVTGPIE